MIILAAVAIYVGAAIAEMAGCNSVSAWLRLERSPLWLVPGVASLLLFAFLLTRIEAGFASRGYAAYGGIYIVASARMALGRRGEPAGPLIGGAIICSDDGPHSQASS